MGKTSVITPRVYRWLPLQIGLVLAIVLGMAVWILSAMERRLLNGTGQTLSLAAADIADKLDLLLYERSGDMQALARSSVLPLLSRDRAMLTANLAAVQNAYPIYLWLAMADKSGTVIASTDAVSRGSNLSGQPSFAAARDGGGLHVEGPRLSEAIQGATVIAFSMPVIGPDDAFLGVVTAHVGLPALLDLFPRTVHIFESKHGILGDVEWELLNQDGTVLSESNSPNQTGTNLLELQVPSARLSLDAGTRPGYIEEVHGRRGIAVVTGYAHTNGYGRFTSPLLGILIREGRSEILGPIEGFLVKLGAAGAALILPLLAMLAWTSIRLRREWLAALEAERTTRESEARFRAIFEQAAVGMAQVSPSGQWLRVNQRLCDIVGYSREVLLQRTFQDITHPDDLQSDLDYVGKMLANEISTYAMEKRYIRKDRKPIWINLTVSLVRDEAGAPKYFVAVIEDIAVRKAAEDRLRHFSAELEQRVVERTAQLEEAIDARNAEIAEREQSAARLQESVARAQRQGSALMALTTASKPDDLSLSLQRITETAARTLGVERVSIWQYNADRTLIHCTDLYESAHDRHVEDGDLRAADYPAYFDALAHSDLIDAGDAHHDPRTSQFSEGYLRPLGIGAMLDAPIRFHGGTDGVLCHEHVGPARQWTQDEKTFAVALANLISLELEEQARRKATEALRRSEEWFRSLIEKSTDIITVLDAEGIIRYESPSAYQLLGYDAEDLLGKPVFDFLHPDDHPEAKTAMAQAIASPEIAHKIELRFRSGIGEWRVMEATGRSTKDTHGRQSVILNSRDVTERKQAELDLFQSREMLRLIIDTIPQYVFWKDRTLHYLGCNTLFAKAAGVPAPAAIIGKTDYELSWKNLAELYREDDRLVMDTNRPKLNFEEPLAGRQDMVIRTSKVPLLDSKGTVFGVLGIFEDVTERKRVEEALQVSEERFRAIFDQAPLGIALIDSMTGHIYAVNARFAQIAGRSVDEMTRIDWMSITHPEDIQKDLDSMALLNAGKISGFQMEKRYLRPAGDEVWINMTIAPVTTTDRSTRRHLAMIEDITERKRNEEALRGAEARFRTLVEQPMLGFYIINDAGRITYANVKLADIFGYTLDEILALDPLKVVAPNDRERIAANIRRRLGGEPLPPNYGFKGCRKDGGLIDVEVYAARVELHGRPAIIGIIRDVTEFNRLQAESRRLERMAAMGQLLGGIAHELKNPLFILSGHLQLFKDRLQAYADPGVTRDFKKIEDAAKRIVMITEHFVHLARPTTSKRQLCAVRTLLEAATDALSHELTKHRISLAMLLDDGLHRIWTDPVLLREVFHHLITNAIQAMAGMPGRRTLTVTACERETTIEICIQDTGPGIPPDLRNKIFEPFFTTKPATEGTGMGLWIVRSNLLMLGGSVKVESPPGHGALFTASLPLVTTLPAEN